MPKTNNAERTLSVILPIYNTDKKLLTNCFASISSLWDERLEIIAVDDGSESQYAFWLDEVVRNLSFPCTLLRQENGGQNAARTYGLENAHAKWVLFLDSDDLLDEALGGLLDHLDKTQADLCLIGLQMESSEREVYRSTLPPEPRDVVRESVLERCPSLCGFVAQRKLLLEDRCSLVEGPRIAEDIASAFKIIASAQSLTSYPFLYRYVMNYSSTTSKPRAEWMLDPIKAFRPLVETWDGGYEELLSWVVILHVRILGCERVLCEMGLSAGRREIEQLCDFSERIYPHWRDSQYYERYVRSLDPWDRVKIVPIAKGHWRASILAMKSVKALVWVKGKVFTTPASRAFLRRILGKVQHDVS